MKKDFELYGLYLGGGSIGEANGRREDAVRYFRKESRPPWGTN